MVVLIDRGDYWQCAYVIPKGGYRARSSRRGWTRSAHASLARADVRGPRRPRSRAWDQIKLLTVAIDRLRDMASAGAAVHRRCRARDVADRRGRRSIWRCRTRSRQRNAGGAAARAARRRDDDLARVQQRREFPDARDAAHPGHRAEPDGQPRPAGERRDEGAAGDAADGALAALAAHPGAACSASACGRSMSRRRRRGPARSDKRGMKPSPFASIWQQCGAPKCPGASSAPDPAQSSSSLRRDCRAAILIEAGEAVPCRMIDLDGVMDRVAAEERLAALRRELDHHMPGRVAGRRLDRQMLLDRLRAVDHLRQPGLDHRQHAVAQRAMARRAFLRVAIELQEIIVVGLAEDVAARSGTSAPSGRCRAACSSRRDRRADACTSPCRSARA